MRFLSPFRLIGCQFLLIRWIHVGWASGPVQAFFHRLMGSYVASVKVIHRCFHCHRLLVLLLQVLLLVLLFLVLLLLLLLLSPLFPFRPASFYCTIGIRSLGQTRSNHVFRVRRRWMVLLSFRCCPLIFFVRFRHWRRWVVLPFFRCRLLVSPVLVSLAPWPPQGSVGSW